MSKSKKVSKSRKVTKPVKTESIIVEPDAAVIAHALAGRTPPATTPETRKPPKAVAPKASKRPLNAQILELMEASPKQEFTVRTITETLKSNYNSTAYACTELKKFGKIHDARQEGVTRFLKFGAHPDGNTPVIQVKTGKVITTADLAALAQAQATIARITKLVHSLYVAAK